MKKEVITIKGKIEQNYEWPAGIAGTRFLQELRDKGRIVGTKCSSCGDLKVVPRIFCEVCFKRIDDNWEVASNTGTINTYTVSYTDIDAGRLEEPVILAVINLDGGGSLFHYLGEVEPDKIHVGMKVEAAFKDQDERTGSILDIKYFKPVS